MKAAVVREFGTPLVLEDRETPEPAARQVLVRLEASGLCHTDIHAANGDWPVTPTVPFIPGHEGIGIVDKVEQQDLAVRHQLIQPPSITCTAPVVKADSSPAR